MIDDLDKYLGFKLNEKDFLCHRFGMDPDGKGPQNVMIRFANPKTKIDLMKKRGGLKTSPLFFKEFLTDKQFSIHYQAREAKRNGILQNAWSWDGLIWGVAEDSPKPGLISDYTHIKEQNQLAVQEKVKAPVAEATAMEVDPAPSSDSVEPTHKSDQKQKSTSVAINMLVLG